MKGQLTGMRGVYLVAAELFAIGVHCLAYLSQCACRRYSCYGSGVPTRLLRAS